MHDPLSANVLVGLAVTFMLAWAAFAFFGFCWLTYKLIFSFLEDQPKIRTRS